MQNAATELLSEREPDRKRTDATVAKLQKSSGGAAYAAATAAGIIQEWGNVYNLTATHCTCCGIELRDALSVTRGIGPVCSSNHYDIDFPITEAMIEDALGTLHASGLEAPVKKAAKQLKLKPRDLCNVLIWWSSAHLDETETVLDCAAVVSALGFHSLGDRLRERNTEIVVTRDGNDNFIVRCRSNLDTRRDMARVKEAVPVPREGRFKYGWTVPNNRQALVWTILGDGFGGQWATIPGTGDTSKVEKIEPTTWRDIRDAFRAAYPEPKVETPKPLVVRPGEPGWLEIHTPHRNFSFIAEFKQEVDYRDRTWNRDKVCWTVRETYEGAVRSMVSRHFNGAK